MMLRAWLAAACLVPATLFAARELPPPVRAALTAARVPSSAAAVVVEPVADGPVLVHHNAREPMNPASVMKVVTAQAALELLGPAFTFHTDFLATGEIRDGVLDGDLVIRGAGDPKLTYERLWQAAHLLRARGLREVRGDVILDRGHFAVPPHDPARFDNDPRRAYNTGADALLLNWNAIDFRFVPEGSGVRVLALPDLPNVEIVSRVRLVQEPCGPWRRRLQQDVHVNGLLATVVFSGDYAAGCGEQTWPLAIFEPQPFAEMLWRWAWSQSGGVLRGKVRAGPTPEGARLLQRFESPPLADLVRDMNKYSNNVMARHLFLALSAERAPPGELQASARIVREWLAARGIEAPELVLDNGSGLSREARVSAATLAAVLRAAWSSGVMPELASSFPILSVDGTLKSRSAEGAAGRAHLKGGTLNGVQAMAGYVLDAGARRWIVVMLVNHPNANNAHAAFDALVEWVYRQPRKGGPR